MTRRRVLVVLGVLAAGGMLAAGGWWLTTPRVLFTPEQVEQITAGMTLEEVEAILGAPPGDYTTRPLSPEAAVIRQLCRPGGRGQLIWRSDGLPSSPAAAEWVADDG